MPLTQIFSIDKGRQSLLASGITEKLLEILKIDVGDNLVFQAMRIFRALSEQEDIQDFEKFSRDVAQPIIKLLERTTLEDRTIEEILGTLELLALSTNFQSSLIQQPLVDIIQELLKKGEDAVTEGVLRVVAMIMCLSDGSEDGPNIKLIDPNSLFPLLKKMPLSYKVLEALINIAPYYTEECISSGFLDVLILAVQSDKLPAMVKSEAILVVTTIVSGPINTAIQDARAKVSTEERDFVEDINFAEAIKSSGAQQYLEIARSFVSVLVKIIPRTSGMTVLEGLTSITSFVQQGGVVANTEDIVRLVTWVLNQAYQKWHGGSEIFGYLYTEILWESINLLNALEDNSPANRQALLESGAYKLVLLLANIPDIAHKLLNQTVEYMRDLDDDRLNAEVNKYSAPLHLNGASDTLLSDSTSRYLATELAEHTHGDPYGERLKLSMARSNSL